MKFPGKLEAGLKNGILTDSKYIKGTYIVFPTFDDMYELSFKDCECENKESVLIEGVKCFLVQNTSTAENQEKYPGGNEYRWNGSDWELLPTPFFDAPIDSDNPEAIYGRQNGKWVPVSFLDLDYFNSEVEKINASIATKQAQLVDGENIKTFYGQSLLIKEGENTSTDIQVPVATTEIIGGLKSGTDIETEEGEEFFKYEVSIDPDTEIGSVKIPSLTSTTTAQELITILEQGGELTLNGGKAPAQGD